MKYSYVYNGTEYSSAWEVRQAIATDSNTLFRAEPDRDETAEDPGKERREFWAALGVTYTETAPTEEELAAQELEWAKMRRATEVAKITVTVDGMVFDGDETAQTRMGRTIAAAIAQGVDLETTKRTWVLADNTVAEVTVKQLAEALQLAGDAQTALWTVPYEAAAAKANVLEDD